MENPRARDGYTETWDILLFSSGIDNQPDIQQDLTLKAYNIKDKMEI